MGIDDNQMKTKWQLQKEGNFYLLCQKNDLLFR